MRQPWLYTIDFENIPTATAAAQRIRITDQLDPNLDPRTFRLQEIGFGKYRITVPENRAFFQGRVQLGEESGNIFADISAGVDIATGQVTWTLTAIDPSTGEQPLSASLGLLPPNDETGRGQGFVTYTILPKAGAPTGTVISNNATIIFDTEEPITTNTVTNMLDADSPTSAVNPLPASSQETFTISWSGSDVAGGSELQNFDIWVSENDGPYQSFLTATTETSAEFTGQSGRTYRFYSIARDNAGNIEAAPSDPDAVTTVAAEADVAITKTATPNPVFPNSVLTYTLIVTNNGPSTAQAVRVTDELSSGLSLISCAATVSGVCGGAGNNVIVTFDSLSPGASATITLMVTVQNTMAPGVVINNTANVATETPDPNMNNNAATVDVTVSRVRTETRVSPSINPSVEGQSVRFMARVYPVNIPSGIGAMPAGTVEFFDGSASLGSAVLSEGIASLVTSSLAFGEHSITAVYSGDANYLGNTSFVLAHAVNHGPSLIIFGGRDDFGTGDRPASITKGLFNVDDKPDLAVANEGDDSVSILLGAGDGTFSARTDFAAGDAPVAVTAGDFNVDGKTDLAAVNKEGKTVSILLGNGAGAFGEKSDFEVGAAAVGIAIGDFNADAKLDLAVINSGDNSVSILLGNGNGTFGTKSDFAAGSVPSAVIARDFNGDGKLDLAVANKDGNTISILPGKGDGTFDQQTEFSTGLAPSGVVAGDFNRDGKIDLAATESGDNTVSILTGVGDGTFGNRMSFATGEGPHSIKTGDFNGDNRLDLVVANLDDTFSILLGRDDGGFGPRTDFGRGGGSGSIETEDFDDDGGLDIAVANSDSDTVSILLNVFLKPAANLAIAKLASPSVVLTGSNVTYTITVTNNGPGVASSVTVTDSLDGNLTFVSCNATGSGVCGGTGNNRIVTFDQLLVGASANITIVAAIKATVVDGAVINNQVTVSSAITDPDPGNNSAEIAISASNPPPSITCPQDVFVAAGRPGDGKGGVVAYPAPTVTDNTPGTTVVSTPPSGSIFRVGTTTVNMKATDAGGATSNCSFKVMVFDISIQDERSGDTLLVNSFTGEYRFIKCGASGFSLTGRGTILRQSCTVRLQSPRVQAEVHSCIIGGANSGKATIKLTAVGPTFVIQDRDILNNPNSCP